MKLLALPLLLSFVGLILFGLFTVGHSVDMTHGAGDCVFVAQQETACPMSVLDHMSAWKSVFMNALPVSLIVFLAGAAVILLGTDPHLVRKQLFYRTVIALRIHQLQIRIYTFVYRILQEFFARGVLHPKLF